MKKLKISLFVYLVFHCVMVFLVNIFAFAQFKGTDEKLSSVGTTIVESIHIPQVVRDFKSSLGLYVNVLGVNRGYEFFSPNVYGGSVKLTFETANGEEIELFRSIESQMKYFTFSLHFNANIQDKEKRDQILKSVCARLFTKYPQLQEVQVFADVKLYDALQVSTPQKYYQDKGKILLSKIRNNNHGTSSI